MENDDQEVIDQLINSYDQKKLAKKRGSDSEKKSEESNALFKRKKHRKF
jgi:hypothetical protein